MGWQAVRRVAGGAVRSHLAAALLIGAGVVAAAGCDLVGREAEPTPASTPTPSPELPTPTSQPTAVAGAPVLRLDLTVAVPPGDLPDYDRGDWRHWRDADRDCQDARQEVLIAESAVPVAFESTERCRVAAGSWVGPYTGEAVTDPGKLDVDHVVPLANAHRSGGWDWSKDRKAAYANDLEYEHHLIATTARANRSKGSQGPEDWRPPEEDYWCEYATHWAAIKSRWELTVTERELQALQGMLTTCAEPVALEATYR